MLARATSLLAPLCALGASLVLWPFIPDPMPIHWGIDGRPDGFASRAVGLLLVPVLALTIPQVIRWVTGRDTSVGPKARRGLEHTLAATAVFLSAIHGLALAAALGDGTIALGCIAGLMGGLFVVVGLSMRGIEPNRWMGVRTAATLSDPAIWTVVHDKTSIALALVGAATIVSAVALPASAALVVAIVGGLVVGVGSMVFAWALGRARR